MTAVAWAGVDAWAAERDERLKQREAAAAAERTRRATSSAHRNVQKWFRYLPVELALDLVEEARGPNGFTFAPSRSTPIANDWLLSNGFKPTALVPRRPPTIYEKRALLVLAPCRFPPASFDKRFVRGLAGADSITDGEAAQLPRLLTRYRKQIRSEDLPAPLKFFLLLKRKKEARRGR